MIKAKDLVKISLWSTLVIVALCSSSEDADDFYDRSFNSLPLPFERKFQYLLEDKRAMNGIKNLIENLENKLEKRTGCVLDGGLSASCNHKDAVEAGEHHRFLASSFAPGRRKRGFSHLFSKISDSS